MSAPDIEKLVAEFKSRDALKRGEWLAKILERFDREGAETFLKKIQQVWRIEAPALPAGEDRDRPDPGLLKAVGYGVGWRQGQPADTRKIIVMFILGLADHLPPIKDQQYMAEWGSPRSWKRYWKLDRVLLNLIAEHREDGRMIRAVQEWEEDREFARRVWEEIRLDLPGSG